MIRAHQLVSRITGLVSKNSCLTVLKPEVSIFNFSTFRESQPTVFEFLVHRHQFSPKVASYVDSALSSILKYPENSDSAISFLKEECGFTTFQLERTFKRKPNLLWTSVEKTIKPKIKVLQDEGFTAEDIAVIISKEPYILVSSLKNRVIPSLSLLRDLLRSNIKLAKVLSKTGWLLRVDLEKKLVPNIKYLNNCGISMEQINILFNTQPRIFLYKPEVMRECVEKVDQLGMDRSSKMFVYAVGAVSSMANGTTWELKLQAFRDILEFSQDDILTVLRKYPQAFSVSEGKMNKLKEVLLATGKYEISCIVKYPKSLMSSIEKRLNPRLEVLHILESRHLIQKWPCLGRLCDLSDARFIKEFVSPYVHDLVLYNSMIKLIDLV